MGLLTSDARRILDSPTAAASDADVRALRREVTSPRRLVGGAAAVALALLGGLGAGFAGSELSAGREGGALAATALALALLVPAAVIGALVVAAGRRVVSGYVERITLAAPTSPDRLVRSLLGPGLLLRSALTAAAVIGACIAASVVWLGTTEPRDPATMAMGAVWLVTATAAATALLGGELRVVRAEGRRTRA
jgi:hypothetical protein